MALSSARLQAALLARFKTLYRDESPDDEVHNENYWLNKLAQIIAEEVVSEIVTFARCNGLDSDGDSHDNVQII